MNKNYIFITIKKVLMHPALNSQFILSRFHECQVTQLYLLYYGQ